MEYDNEGKGSLWLADKQTRDGDNYYNGNITINGIEHKLTMFINKSDNERAPKFRLKVNQPQIKVETKQEEKSDPYKEFAELVEKNKEDYNEEAGF